MSAHHLSALAGTGAGIAAARRVAAGTGMMAVRCFAVLGHVARRTALAGLWTLGGGLAFFLPGLAHAQGADNLSQQLTRFMLSQYATPPVSVEVVVKTPASQLNDCDAPQFSLPSRYRIWGNISIAMVCGAQKRYLQAEVRVTDKYLVAARPISAKQTLTAQDVVWRTGRLDVLNTKPLADMALAVGSVSERAIGSGQPLAAAMLRRPWRVKTGQQVQVSAQGEGFAVQSTGKAMDNAAVNDRLRVRMDSGQLVNGQLQTDGTVHVML